MPALPSREIHKNSLHELITAFAMTALINSMLRVKSMYFLVWFTNWLILLTKPTTGAETEELDVPGVGMVEQLQNLVEDNRQGWDPHTVLENKQPSISEGFYAFLKGKIIR